MDIEKTFNISICSYNLFWEVMDNDFSKNSGQLVKKIGKDNLNELKSNILKNIFFIKNIYNPYFYCFQEAVSWTDITNLFELSLYEYYVGKSGPEYILTVWKSHIFEKKFVFDGEFESGRPFTIFIFKDLRFNLHFILINIHASHNKDTFTSIFEPIQKILSSVSIINNIQIKNLDIKRIIICGDFNRDISAQIINDSNISNSLYKLKINSKEYYFKPFISNNKTCCNLNGYAYNKNYDQVIDTFDKPLIIHVLNKEKWYTSKSSDHVAVLAIVKNIL